MPAINQESNIMRAILLACGRGASRLFRQNVGQGWQGRRLRLRAGQLHRVKPGDVILENARPLTAGLCKGSSDFIGWHSVEITPDMVGRKIAVFAGLEVKTEKGRATKEQQTFIDAVKISGGIAGVVRSAEEAGQLFEQYK